ncbi:MAG TPA: class I SAM-dependent methyltransferase [Solirubrobacteraceae bacterium]|jgi:SAM-dependent methyltransferase|nr:class I SAM-dependent methyltransferase [Solirubrobacteraceae bacterium]
MTADDQTTPLARAAEFVQRGPAPVPGLGPRSPRGLLRRVVLRLIHPFTHHQREVDGEIVGALRQQEAELEHLAERHSEQIERLEDLARELILTAEQLRKDAVEVSDEASVATSQAVSSSAASRETHAALDTVRDELNASPYMTGSPFEAFQAQVGSVLGFRSRGSLGKDGSDYALFEDLFRGPSERVVDAQRPYLDLVKDHQPVLDLGCGRGEFLALLAEEGVVATGVDSDPGMVTRCLKLGLEVTEADVNEHLASLPDGTLGTIFSAQVIEHLPYEQLRLMLELALRKLRPDGLLIAETVNPHRIASLKTFWVDLTHQHPIFPEVALAICGIAGFNSAYVFAPTFDNYEESRLHSPAYAVVATTPSAGTISK